MKKTYIAPKALFTRIRISNIIATSPLVFDPTEEISSNDDIGVKGNYYNSPRYNVWDDDWSK